MEKVSIKQLFGKSTRRVRILSALLVAAVSVVGFVYYFGVVSPSMAKAFSGTGAGSEDQPYQVSNCTQLQEMKNNQDSHYVLVSDIECADTITWNDDKGFEPITYFTGSLDGRNYSIHDLYINRVGEIELGLFRRLAGGAEVKNLYLNKNTSSPTRTDISGAPMIGAVAAVLENGKIYNVHSTLNVQARQGPVDEAGQSNVALRVGGLVGISYSDVEASSNTGKVSVLKSEGQGRTIDIGGLVGVLSDDFNGGDVYPSIEDSYARSEVDAYTTFANHGGSCGGLVGGVSASRDNKYETIKYSYSQGSVSCGGPDINMNQASFIGAISVGGQTTSPPVITDNFTQTNTSSSYGFYGGYYINNRDSDKSVTDFHTNTFDMFATNSGFCGPTDVDGLLETICAGENVANASPNYFKTGQNSTEENGWDSNYYHYDTWDQETIWDMANADDPYPVHKTQTVRPSAPTNLAVTRDGSKLIATWDPITGIEDPQAIDTVTGRADNIVDRQLWYLDNSLDSPEWTEYQPIEYSNYMPGSGYRLNNIDEVSDLAIPGIYTFKVRAVSVDAAGTVSFGLFTPDYSFATGMPEEAPVVTQLQADGVKVDYNWNAVETATAYEVQHRKVGDTNWTVKGSNITALAIRSYLAENTTYEFRVVAKNAYGQGPWSDIQTVTTGARRAYTVSTCQQLQDISNDLVGTYTLTNNIDCSSIPNFVPIGGNSEPFMGSLDGKGFTISNVTIQSDAEVVGGTFAGVGLFGVAIAANLQNITLKDSTIVGNYALDESVDPNGNGLPDVEIPDVNVSNPIDIPTSVADYNENGITSIEALQDTQDEVASSTSVTLQDLGVSANQFPTFAVGSLAGVYIGGGTQTNVKVTNTMVQGMIAGGVYGAVVPIPNIAELGNTVNSKISGSQVNGLSELAQLLSGVDKNLTLNNFQSSGTVNGFMGGGLIGLGTSSIGSMIGLDGNLVLQNSSSSVSVEANVGGGLMGGSVSLSTGSVYYAFASQQEQGNPVQDIGSIVSGAIDTFTNTQTVIIKNSYATGTVSSCNVSNGVRLGSLGGLVGFGAGTLIQDSYASGAVSSCSSVSDQRFVYGGSMGGLAGLLITSKIQGSHSSGTVSANRASGQDQTEAPIYIGSVGGLAGIMVATDSDESDGNYVVDNSYATGKIDISGKNGMFSLSGGLFGMFLNSGTINNSHSSSKITTTSGPENVFSFSASGGLTGVTVGVDVAAYFKSAYNFPSFSTFSKGANIVNSYATGDVISASGNTNSGQFALTGGLTGFFLGGGNITSSRATGNVVSSLPNKLGNCENSFEYLTSPSVPCTGNAISGGLVGSAYGVDVPGVVSSVFQGLGLIGPSRRVTSQGLIVHDSHASGEVKGNIVGGLFGSAELEVGITKSYAEGAVRGNIAGGLVGQSGLVSVAGIAGLGVFASTQSGVSPIVVEGAPMNMGQVMNQGLDALGPLEINNSYSTSPITADPYSVDVLVILGGLGPGEDLDDEDFSAIEDKVVARLPTIAGGLVGLYSTPGGSITNSYASGAITVVPSKISGTNLYDLDLPEPNNQPKDFDVPFTSFAGGVFGVNISVPNPDFTKVVGVLAKDRDTVDIPSLSRKAQTLENVFSASSLNVPGSSFTGATAGWLMNPLEAVDQYVLGNTTTDRSKILKIDNVHYDKSKIITTGCNGPYKSVMQIRDGAVNDIDAADGQVGDLVSDMDNAANPDTWNEERTDNSGNKLILTLMRKTPSQSITEGLDIALAPQTTCQFVNANNSQPNYFKNNKVNAPMNVWNFSDVWKTKKDGYPVFVAGATTNTPSDPTTPGDNPDGSGTGTSQTPTSTTPEQERTTRNTQKNIAKKLGFSRDAEQVKGLKAILARLPLFLARSIPYSLVLLLLILATMYSYQALREYYQLKIYHANIMRIINTKEAIDNYLAITTHYLNTPVAIMGGAVELMVSLKKVSATKAASLQTKIRKFADASAGLLTANQVSNAQSANDEKLIRHEQPSPFKAKAVWVPAVIALGLITLANVLFIYADMFNSSPYRIFVELGLYSLGVLLVGLAYRYRNFMMAAKELARQRLTMESQLYKKRQAFIPVAIEVVSEHYENIKVASESLKKVPEARLFFNGLSMLGGINKGLVGVKQFANFESDPPLFDISTYVKKAVHEQNTKAKDRNITFDAKISSGLLSRIHPEEVRQITDSLLSNAVKFSKDGGHIEVQAYRRFNKLVLSVSDDGVGISAQKLPSLLKPFSRGTESMEYNYDGLGLDLYTDKIIIERLGGTISIQSELGKGTLATISLPMTRAPKSAIAPVLIMPEATAA